MPEPNKILVRVYSTDTLAIAAWLYAAGLLQLLDARPVSADDPEHIEFVFADPDRKGEVLEGQYVAGNAPVNAPQFHSALRRLRRKLEMAKQRAQFSPAYADESRERSTSNTNRQQPIRGNRYVANSNSNRQH